MDLGERRYATFAELYEYCIRVASAVGLMCLDIFGARDQRARQYDRVGRRTAAAPISCVMFPKIFAAAGSTFRSRICGARLL